MTIPIVTQRIYDPMLGEIAAVGGSDPGSTGFMTRQFGSSAASVRLMIIGDAAAVGAGRGWLDRLGTRLAERGTGVTLLEGFGDGHGAARELLRVLRDAPGIAPHLVVALSGVVDGAGDADRAGHPFEECLLPAIRSMMLDTGLADSINLGVTDGLGLAERWCLYHRLAAQVAAEFGAHHLAVLRPWRAPAGQFDSFGADVRAIVAADPRAHAHVVDLRDAGCDDVPAADGDPGLVELLVAEIRRRFPQWPPPPARPAEIDPGRLSCLAAANRATRAAGPRIVVTSTTPRLTGGGLATALAATGRFASVDERTFGAASMLSLAVQLKRIDFSRVDILVIDHGGTDEVLLSLGLGELGAMRARLLEAVDRAARAGCRTVCLTTPVRNRFRSARPVRDLVVDTLRPAGVPVLDLYAVLQQAAAAAGRPVEAAFQDGFRLTAAMERSVAAFLAARLVDIGREPRQAAVEVAAPHRAGGVVLARVDDGGEAAAGDDEPMRRFASGTRICLTAPAGSRLIGVWFDPGASGCGLLDADGEVVFAPRNPARKAPARIEENVLPTQLRTVPADGRLVFTVGPPIAADAVATLGLAGFIVEAVEARACIAVVPTRLPVVLEDLLERDRLARFWREPVAPPASGDVAAPAVPGAIPPRDARGGPAEPDARPTLSQRIGHWMNYLREPRAIVDLVLGREARNLKGMSNVTENADNSIGVFDPLLGQVNSKAGHAHFQGGYKIWPGSAEVARSKYRIMTIGNSTSLWPAYPWSMFLGKRLRAAGYPVAIYNGAGKGHSSSQELLRIVRDAPGIRPDLVIALSGICDIGYLVNAQNYPFLHKYSRDLIDMVKRTGYAATTNPGYPDTASPAQVWLRNQRLARLVAAEMGIEYLTVLQPVMGYGRYQRSAEEEAMFRQKAVVVLKSFNKPYLDAVHAFYDEVLEALAAEPQRYPHVVNLIDVFADAHEVYKDHRHLTEEGCQILAEAIEKIVLARFDVPRAEAGGASEGTGPVSAEPDELAAPDLEADEAVSAEEAEEADVEPPAGAAARLVHEPPRPMRVLISGTSNSVMTPGYTSAIGADPRVAQVANHSLGASGTAAIGYHLPNIDFSAHDLCIVEYCVNEEVFLLLGEGVIEETKNNILNLVDRAARAGCRCLFLVMPSQNRFRFPRPFQAWLETEMRARGLPVLDCYRLLQRAIDHHDIPIPSLFLDKVHLKREVAMVIGRFLVDVGATLLSRPIGEMVLNDDLRHQPLTYVPAPALKAKAAAAHIERSSRLVSAKLVDVPVGSAIAVESETGGAICGLAFDAGSSTGRLVLDDGTTVFATKEAPAAGRSGKLTLVCHPVGRPVPYGKGGFSLRHEGEPDSGQSMAVAGVVIQPDEPSRATAIRPEAEELRIVEDLAPVTMIDEIAALVVK